MSYHWRKGVYFNRSKIDEGTVDITVPDFGNPGKSQVLSIPPNEWASIVAAVSACGENAETYALATRLHSGPESSPKVTACGDSAEFLKEHPEVLADLVTAIRPVKPANLGKSHLDMTAEELAEHEHMTGAHSVEAWGDKAIRNPNCKLCEPERTERCDG